MATTTNYSWTTPDDTDLVKDGAAAIRTLGSSIDTTTKALNPSTTLGDIEYRSSTANTNTRLALGTAGQVLQVNSGATAPEWATFSANGMTLINTGGTTLTGGSVTISSIPSTYRDLQLVIRNFRPNGGGDYLWMRYNGDSGTRYKSLTAGATLQSFDTSIIQLSDGQDNATAQGLIVSTIYDYANTATWKMETHFGLANRNGSPTNFEYRIIGGFYNQTSAISSITLGQTGASFNSGTAFLYGVK
jgi:hypothetical protein